MCFLCFRPFMNDLLTVPSDSDHKVHAKRSAETAEIWCTDTAIQTSRTPTQHNPRRGQPKSDLGDSTGQANNALKLSANISTFRKNTLKLSGTLTRLAFNQRHLLWQLPLLGGVLQVGVDRGDVLHPSLLADGVGNLHAGAEPQVHQLRLVVVAPVFHEAHQVAFVQNRTLWIALIRILSCLYQNVSVAFSLLDDPAVSLLEIVLEQARTHHGVPHVLVHQDLSIFQHLILAILLWDDDVRSQDKIVTYYGIQQRWFVQGMPQSCVDRFRRVYLLFASILRTVGVLWAAIWRAFWQGMSANCLC